MRAPAEGVEWIVDATACHPRALRDRRLLDRLVRALIADLDLHPVGAPTWHRFPRTGGLTAAWILSESHITLHTFPEFGSLCLNFFACRPRPKPAWRKRLRPLGGTLRVRRVARRYAPKAARC